MDMKEKALLAHENWNGKLETIAKSKVNSHEDLAIAYTPGVAEPCKEIAADVNKAYTYTWKANTVAVVSDGSAVPICLDTQDTEEIITAVKNECRVVANPVPEIMPEAFDPRVAEVVSQAVKEHI